MVADVSTTPNPRVTSHRKPNWSPLSHPELHNEPQRPKLREVSSRYMSTASSTSATSSSATSSFNSPSSRRCPSPLSARKVPETPMINSTVKRAYLAEWRRPVMPRPATPSEMSNAAKMLMNSTTRLSVSFQGDACPLPISKARPGPAFVTNSIRKATPERRKVATPVKDQTENWKPTSQQRWPGRSGGEKNTSQSVDFTAERLKSDRSRSVVRACQESMIVENRKPKLKSECQNAQREKPIQLVIDAKSTAGSAIISDPVASDTDKVCSGTTLGVQGCGSVAQVRGGPCGIVVPTRGQETNNRLRRVPEPGAPTSNSDGLVIIVPGKLVGRNKFLNDSPTSSPRGTACRGLMSPLGGVRPASACKFVTSSTSSVARGITSPNRTRSGVGSVLSNNLSSKPSVLNFTADLRRGKINESAIGEAHELRMLYNRHLQWRFVNARAGAAMLTQRATAEKNSYNARISISKLQHSVESKRVQVQLLEQNLKLYSIFKGQMPFIDNWDQISGDHTSSLFAATEALRACTIRIPIVGGTRADVFHVKDAICSATDVLQAMESSICSSLTKVEQVNSMVSEVARVSAEECALLEQCKELLSTSIASQVKESSLRTHILQHKRNFPQG